MPKGIRAIGTGKDCCLPGGIGRLVLFLLLLAGSLGLPGAGGAHAESVSIVSDCATGTLPGPQGCLGDKRAEPVAPLRQPARKAPLAPGEPAADLLPASLTQQHVARAAGPPTERHAVLRAILQAEPRPVPVVAVLPRPTPGLAALHRAQSFVRRSVKATAVGLDRLEDAASRIRPEPWRTAYDAAGWRLTAARMAGLSPFGGPDARMPIALPLPGGRPGQELRFRWHAGFDGARVTDFALPGLFASRLLVARYYHGPLFRLTTGVGSLLLPMPESAPAVTPGLFSQEILAGRKRLLPEPEVPVSPVPLPPAAPLMVVPLALLAILGRRKPAGAGSRGPQRS